MCHLATFAYRVVGGLVHSQTTVTGHVLTTAVTQLSSAVFLIIKYSLLLLNTHLHFHFCCYCSCYLVDQKIDRICYQLGPPKNQNIISVVVDTNQLLCFFRIYFNLIRFSP